jgi:NADPH-dependent 2,4-dienoyl-CoA reductase/sulfur reductase-like enzyme
MPQRLVVIGGDAAGMSAASQARRRAKPSELEIVAFERGQYTSYSACGLPYFVGGLVKDAQDLIARSPDEHRANGIDVRTGHEVVDVDVDARQLMVRRHRDHSTIVEGFDQLVFATGAVPVKPDLPGSDAKGIYGIQTITDGIALREHVVHSGVRRAVVVGGGYVGLEMAEAMTRAGLDVVLLDRSPQPMNTIDPDMGAVVADVLRGLGIELHMEVAVHGFEQDADGNVAAVATEGHAFPADIVVLGLGVKPGSRLAHDAGVAVGTTGGIVTDRRMATKTEGVWAAGDCVETFHRVSRRPVAMALGTHANKQGKVVGDNVTGGYSAFPGVIGTAVTKVCELEVARTGLSEREAHAAGFEFVVGRIESTTRAAYYPDSSTLHVKVLADARNGTMLGAQIVGREGAAKRIDVLATAIWTGMTADEFSMLDLAYAPPYSPVWDPTLVAARKAVAEINSR